MASSRKSNSSTTSSQSSRKKADTSMAESLLALHVAHEMNNFQLDSFLSYVKDESEILFEWVRSVKLNETVSPDQVKGVIQRNVVDANIPGAIAEIAGEASSRLFNSAYQKEVQLRDLLSRKQFEEIVDKVLELKEQRNKGLDKLIDLPIYGDLISGILYKSILRYIYESNLITKKVPGVSSMLKIGKSVMNKAAPKLGSGIEDSVRSFIVDSLDFILLESKSFLENSVTDEQLKVSAMELWSLVEDKPLSEFQRGMDSLDLSDFVSLGYDFWLQFRKSAYFQHSYETVVDYFFEKYGDENLSELLDDLNISPERILIEVENFAPLVLETLRESGQLEALIKRRFEAFYFSQEALDCLSSTT